MKRDLALQVFKQHVTDELVVAVYQSCFDWLCINPRDLNYVGVGAMGQASSHGLGLALANPDRSVLVFDGDGSLLMNMGSLVTIAQAAPGNFHHFVFVNGVYEVNGAHPTPGRDHVDFAAIAAGAGYKSALTFSDLNEFEQQIGNVLAEPGPVLVALNIEPGNPYPRDYDYIHSAEARDKFRTALMAT